MIKKIPMLVVVIYLGGCSTVNYNISDSGNTTFVTKVEKQEMIVRDRNNPYKK